MVQPDGSRLHGEALTAAAGRTDFTGECETRYWPEGNTIVSIGVLSERKRINRRTGTL
jgi:hypothetical protein